MNPMIILSFLLFASVAGNVAEWVVISGKNDTIAARDKEIRDVWKVENKALAAKLELANGEVDNVHAMLDALDKQARSSKEIQQKKVLELATKLQAAGDERDSLFQQLTEQIDARPIIVTQKQGVPDGWDPAVVDGMRRLKCMQLGGTPGGPGDIPDCRLQDHGDSGRSGLAGQSAGTDYPRPSAKQQLEFLSWAWRLRDWGASCYQDKRAIAAAQVTP